MLITGAAFIIFGSIASVAGVVIFVKYSDLEMIIAGPIMLVIGLIMVIVRKVLHDNEYKIRHDNED